MEPLARKIRVRQRAVQLCGHVARMEGSPGARGEHESLLRPIASGAQPILQLTDSMLPKNLREVLANPKGPLGAFRLRRCECALAAATDGNLVMDHGGTGTASSSA